MDYSFVSGQVRAKEASLLSVSQLDRMIGAANPEAAFSVMSELAYADYFDDTVSAADFGKVIQQGLAETKHMIQSGSGNATELGIIWLKFDVNNLKRALKLKYLEGANSIEDFSENNGFSRLGNLDQSALEAIIFNAQPAGNIATPLWIAVNQTSELLDHNNQEFRFVEYALDKAYFQAIEEIDGLYMSDFVYALKTWLIESTNFRMTARSILSHGEKAPQSAWIDGGNIYHTDVEKLESADDFIRWASNTRFASSVSDLQDAEDKALTLTQVEKSLDKAYQQFLSEASMGEVASVQVPYAYFEKRMQNARLLKFVMFAKLNGLDSDTIYKTLETF